MADFPMLHTELMEESASWPQTKETGRNPNWGGQLPEHSHTLKLHISASLSEIHTLDVRICPSDALHYYRIKF